MLSERFSDIWIEGEVSNFKSYPSGHLYFALKDAESQLQAVCFRHSARRLRFELEDGLKVVAHGSLEVYAATGKYQINLDTIEPMGLGALQQAFEQLKRRLEKEGLFAVERKRSLPQLPCVVGIVTSPAGAAIHDMLRTLRLHRAPVAVVLFPAQVQGEGAAQQIAEGVRVLGELPGVDVIIVGRGGGSVEDLWPFNEEPVARAICNARVPVISGVGHEVDFTIADLVADVRAATPTAAALLVAGRWEEFDRKLGEGADALLDAWQELMLAKEQRLGDLASHRVFDLVAGKVAEAGFRMERYFALAQSAVSRRLGEARTAVGRLKESLDRRNPAARLVEQSSRLQLLALRMEQAEKVALNRRRELWRAMVGRAEAPVQQALGRSGKTLAECAARLDTLSPLASLGRGYSICQKADGVIVRLVGQVHAGEAVRLRVSDGTIPVRVEAGRRTQSSTGSGQQMGLLDKDGG
jgi:exodeoxyribonuclease VII large subunit